MSYKLVPVYSSNSNARIQTRLDRNGKTRTETSRRDAGIDVAISTAPRGATSLFIDNASFSSDGNGVQLSGSEARTLYRVLRRHFRSVGRTVASK